MKLLKWFKDRNKVTVLFPGGFKPLHSGHVSLIQSYALHPKVKKVIVFIGWGIRDGIDHNLSLKIAKDLLLTPLLHSDKICIEISPFNSPILAGYNYVSQAKSGIYALAGSKKEDDYKRVEKFVNDFSSGKYFQHRNVKIIELLVDTQPMLYKGRTDKFEGTPISASVLRKDILNNDWKNFKTNYTYHAHYIWSLLKPVIDEWKSNQIK